MGKRQEANEGYNFGWQRCIFDALELSRTMVQANCEYVHEVPGGAFLALWPRVFNNGRSVSHVVCFSRKGTRATYK